MGDNFHIKQQTRPILNLHYNPYSKIRSHQVRSPLWMQRSGLEWLWRIKEEPVLWRRYIGDGLAFLGIFFTLVLPYAYYLKHNQPEAGDLSDATFDVLVKGDKCVVEIKGACSVGNIEKLRTCFKCAVSTEKDIQIDMTHANYVDSAVIGLLMLVFNNQKLWRRRLQIIKLQPQVLSIFRWSRAEFLYK